MWVVASARRSGRKRWTRRAGQGRDQTEREKPHPGGRGERAGPDRDDGRSSFGYTRVVSYVGHDLLPTVGQEGLHHPQLGESLRECLGTRCQIAGGPSSSARLMTYVATEQVRRGLQTRVTVVTGTMIS